MLRSEPLVECRRVLIGPILKGILDADIPACIGLLWAVLRSLGPKLGPGSRAVLQQRIIRVAKEKAAGCSGLCPTYT